MWVVEAAANDVHYLFAPCGSLASREDLPVRPRGSCWLGERGEERGEEEGEGGREEEEKRGEERGGERRVS